MVRFSINDWAAWSADLPDRADWERWLAQPSIQPELDIAPKLSEMPAAMRRRADRLGRAALQAAYWAAPEDEPVVFASRYGEIARSVGMLEQLAAGEALSPTAFSMSVHNAIGALFSIARENRSNYTAIAAGDETVEAAFIEALGLLADGASHVTVVYYEAPLPSVYAQFDAQASFTRGWACRLALAKSGGFSIGSVETPAPSDDGGLPSDLNILRFLLASDAPYFTHAAGSRGWQWSRHG
jgi:hypothetical protein